MYLVPALLMVLAYNGGLGWLGPWDIDRPVPGKFSSWRPELLGANPSSKKERISASSLALAERMCGGVFCAPEIAVDCKEDGSPCSNLYFLDKNGEVLYIHQGTGDTKNFPEKSYGFHGVAKVQTVGDYGCYIIYKQKTAKRKEKGTTGKYCWKGNDKMKIGIENDDYPWTVIRWIFSAKC